MLTFRGAAEDGRRLARRIHRLLRCRHAMHIGELQMRLGTDPAFMRAELEQMRERGEVERLRPVGYAGEELDFFRASRPAAKSAKPDDERVRQAARTAQTHMHLAGQAIACLVD